MVHTGYTQDVGGPRPMVIIQNKNSKIGKGGGGGRNRAQVLGIGVILVVELVSWHVG